MHVVCLTLSHRTEGGEGLCVLDSWGAPYDASAVMVMSLEALL